MFDLMTDEFRALFMMKKNDSEYLKKILFGK
jgi:hypothetical protein